ncbi:DUF6056 family protein [Butyrivibrio hungatei]|uniref:Uncharacterized protein n=1 Tax=Butyrivibrio hungatei TaxID=185008 RepID=A0A1D9NZ61_9FIRM|nr:DUF6056 family protein [Butyrivibrio hungatei]AOZ95509.1 hypothetical protein bhn_I0475 [Butyrivibrio hungatei]
MKKIDKVLIQNIIWVIIIAFLSYMMPYYVDDYQHRLSFLSGKLITNINQIIPSIIEYYRTWGGRIVSMFFIQLMLMSPRIIFSICNGMAYVFVANVIYSYALQEKGQKSACELSLIYLFLWLFMPDFAEVITWSTGTITYLWTNGILLFFGLLYYRDFCNQNRKEKKCTGYKAVLLCIGYFLLGLLAGQSNEAGASTMLLALMAFFVWKIINRYSLASYQIVGAIGMFIGFLTLILAPGNSARIQAVSDASDNTNVLLNYAYRLGRETFYAIMFLMIPFAIVITMYAVRRSVLSRFEKAKTISFIVFAFISVYVMTFSAGFANRVFQLPFLLITIAMAISMVELFRSKTAERVRQGITIFAAIMMVMVCFEITAGMLYSQSRNSFFDRQTIYYHIYDTQGAVSGNGL